MKRTALYIILGFFISGCVASSKTVKPTGKEPVITEREVFPESSEIIAESEGVATSPESVSGTGITYAQITNLISAFMDIKPVENTETGYPRFLGMAENNFVTLEIIGDKDDILQATMKLVYPKDIDIANADLNNALMLRFLRNTVPDFKEWPARVKDVTNKFYSMQKDEKTEERIVLDGRSIDILYDRNIDTIIVTLNHK